MWSLKSKTIRRITIIMVCVTVGIFSSGLTKDQAIYQVVFTSLKSVHYAPKPLNDTFSKSAFTLYLKRIDPAKRFLIQEDINKLTQFELLLDDELKKGSTQFFNLSQTLLNKRVNDIKRLYPKFLKNPILFNTDEFIETDTEKRGYAQNEEDLVVFWGKIIKYQVLNQYLSFLEEDEYKLLKDEKKINRALEKKSRKKVAENLKRFFERISKETQEEKTEIYLNALVNVNDAHTSYFPPEKKEDFDISLSGKLEGIGAVLSEEEGMIKVVRIVTGSAAWRQGELEEGDLIIKVAQGDGERVDIVGARVRDAVKLIRGKKGTEVRLTVKKPNGKTTIVPIVRDVVELEETYAKSLVIEDSRVNRKFGYIYLPKFYRDFKNSLSRNTTDDIRKLLSQLTESNVEGIILDLRHNEGGALQDAVDSSGLFFEEGPVVQIQGKQGEKVVLFDKDKQVSYDGHLVVLMNSYSASASEILAAALQDYKRAVIVGTDSSFGKGTVQTFIDLDRAYPTRAAFFKPLGSLKVTIQKFYRINGGSTQYKGVIPDIILPNPYSHLEVGEKFVDHSLPWDTIPPLSYPKWEKSYPLKTLVKNSKKRVESSAGFNQLSTHISTIKKQQDDSLEPLMFSKAKQRTDSRDKETKNYKEALTVLNHLNFKPTVVTKKDEDEATVEKRKEWIESLSKDIFLDESLSILNDMVESSSDELNIFQQN